MLQAIIQIWLNPAREKRLYLRLALQYENTVFPLPISKGTSQQHATPTCALSANNTKPWSSRTQPTSTSPTMVSPSHAPPAYLLIPLLPRPSSSGNLETPPVGVRPVQRLNRLPPLGRLPLSPYRLEPPLPQPSSPALNDDSCGRLLLLRVFASPGAAQRFCFKTKKNVTKPGPLRDAYSNMPVTISGGCRTIQSPRWLILMFD